MICPLMSKVVKERGSYDQDVTEMSYRDCVVGACAWWVPQEYGGRPEGSGSCAVKLIAENIK